LENYIEINKTLWNERAEKHLKSDFYDVESFLNGRSSLNDIELNLLGDVTNKNILHVQCHFGQDTLSLARLGAKVTGTDFSVTGLTYAKELAAKLNIEVKFILSNTLELNKRVDEKFDIVFASYGVIGWHPDLKPFIQQIHRRLKPGGRFILVEFHPVLWMFDDDYRSIDFSYFNQGAIEEEFYGSYADKNSDHLCTSISWNHSLSELFSSMMDCGMQIEHFAEYDYSPYDIFNKSIKVKKGYQIKGMEKKLPYIFSIIAQLH